MALGFHFTWRRRAWPLPRFQSCVIIVPKTSPARAHPPLRPRPCSLAPRRRRVRTTPRKTTFYDPAALHFKRPAVKCIDTPFIADCLFLHLHLRPMSTPASRQRRQRQRRHYPASPSCITSSAISHTRLHGDANEC